MCTEFMVGILVSVLIYDSEEDEGSSITYGSLLERKILSIEESSSKDKLSRIGSGISMQI